MLLKNYITASPLAVTQVQAANFVWSMNLEQSYVVGNHVAAINGAGIEKPPM